MGGLLFLSFQAARVRGCEGRRSGGCLDAHRLVGQTLDRWSGESHPVGTGKCWEEAEAEHRCSDHTWHKPKPTGALWRQLQPGKWLNDFPLVSLSTCRFLCASTLKLVPWVIHADGGSQTRTISGSGGQENELTSSVGLH